MKKYSRSLALLLAILMIFSVAACADSDTPEVTTEAETASTAAPETTETVTDVTTEEPSVSVVAPPETTEEITTPPETEPPKATDTIRIIMQSGIGEAILSGLAEEKYKSLLSDREKALLYDFGLGIELSKTEDLAEKIGNLVLAGENKYDLILTDPMIGTEMLSSGFLEDLSGAGIAIENAPGIRQSITESLTVGGGIYLYSSYALMSDIPSAYALKYNGAKLSSDPVAKALAGDFTTELLLTYIKESSFSLGEASPLTLYRGVGGKIFAENASGIPTSALTDSTMFGVTYGEALALISASTDQKPDFTVEKISQLKSGEIYLPIPKASVELKYSTPLDHTTLSILAAPVGVVSGTRLNHLVSSLNSSSGAYREAVRAEIIKNGANDAGNLLKIIEDNSRLDLGILFGWGDIHDLISEALAKGTPSDTLLSDRMTEMRNKAVDAAAKIVAERLGK
ncbi:MAG: hypothetical protein J6S71_05210 [Clostridia bacterium]|nr:hypothetical protein [Clostridia bacterium]